MELTGWMMNALALGLLFHRQIYLGENVFLKEVAYQQGGNDCQTASEVAFQQGDNDCQTALEVAYQQGDNDCHTASEEA